MKQLRLYYYTLRYLKPVQIYGRVWFKIKKSKVKIYKTTPSLEFPSLKVNFLKKPENYIHHICCKHLGDWRNTEMNKLFLYHLHYFDYLHHESYSPSSNQWRLSLLENWIQENPPGCYNGWDPYPLSMRIVNWIKWILMEHQSTNKITNSLMTQTDYLSRRLEFHLLGNHLLANAKALLFAGVFFGENSWYLKAVSLLEKQLPQQILEDGGHVERSPQYHCLILEDLLDCVNLLQTYRLEIPRTWQAPIYNMLSWLSVMRHPDGKIPLFNDATLNSAVLPEKLFHYAESLGYKVKSTLGAVFLKDSGYVRLQRNKAKVFIDVAPLGPDYQLGHAHADTFTFELSLDQQRIIVNSGTSTYENNAERLRQRGALAHNTVVINHLNSSEVWSSFRVARRAKVRNIFFKIQTDCDEIQAEHDGYLRDKMNVVHERTWRLIENSLQINDILRGAGKYFMSIPFHLHPDLKVEAIGSHHFVISKDEQILARMSLDSQLTWRLAMSTYHPDFGISIANIRIIAEGHVQLPIKVSHMIFWEKRDK